MIKRGNSQAFFLYIQLTFQFVKKVFLWRLLITVHRKKENQNKKDQTRKLEFVQLFVKADLKKRRFGNYWYLLCLWCCSSHLQFLLQFSSVIPSSSSPQISTAEKINATSTAKQHTKAKITMHFCWDCKEEKENNIDYKGVFSAPQHYCKNKAKVPQAWPPLVGWPTELI